MALDTIEVRTAAKPPLEAYLCALCIHTVVKARGVSRLHLKRDGAADNTWKNFISRCLES